MQVGSAVHCCAHTEYVGVGGHGRRRIVVEQKFNTEITTDTRLAATERSRKRECSVWGEGCVMGNLLQDVLYVHLGCVCLRTCQVWTLGVWGELARHKRSLTHRPQFSRPGIQCPTLVHMSCMGW